MNLKNFTKKNSSIEHCDACPAFFEMTMIGFTHQLYKTKLPAYKIGISHFKQDEADYISLLPDQKNIGQMVINEYLEDKKIILTLYKKWKKEFEKLMPYYYKLFKSDLSNFTNKQIIKKLEELHSIYSHKVSMPGFIDGFMFYAEGRFNDLIQKFCKQNNIPNPITISSTLTSPTSPSFLNEEENDLLSIAKKSSLKNKKIEDHILKYSWIKSSYAGYKEYTKEDALEEIERLGKEDKKDNNLFIDNKNKKIELIKKYKLNAEIVAITELSDILIKWQDQRKQYTLTYVALKNKILKEIAKRTGTPFDLIVYSLNSELKNIFEGKFDLKILKDRKAESLFIHQKGRLVKILTGKPVAEFMKKINSNKISDQTEIKGSVASLGKVQGIVKVVTSVKYLDKLNTGDILVAPMTRPEYLIGMRKAAAIITDDGGITCHAAIVSRELKKPCIIGTKIATKTLNDGDLVEVDANNGIIRLLKKAFAN